MTIPEKIWDKIYNYLEGTCNSPAQAVDYFDLKCSPEEVEEKMLDMGIEICPGCGWWVESGELVDENGEVVFCENCRSYLNSTDGA